MDIGLILLLAAIGLVAGILSGLVGIGGGIVIVPMLVLFLGYQQKLAQGTTLAMFVVPFSILGVMNYHRQGLVNWKIAMLMGVGFVLGSYLGSRFALSLPVETVKKIFAVVLVGVAIKLLFGK